jgi:hypothetical protein
MKKKTLGRPRLVWDEQMKFNPVWPPDQVSRGIFSGLMQAIASEPVFTSPDPAVGVLFKIKSRPQVMLESDLLQVPGLRIETDKRLRALGATSERLAIRYGFKDAAAHQKLLKELIVISNPDLSPPTFDPNTSTIPLDSKTTWKTARQRLDALASRLKSVKGMLHEIVHDPLLYAMIKTVDRSDQFHNLTMALLALTYMAEKAAAVEGKKGRRRLPSWTIKATELCRDFWTKYKHVKPIRKFNDLTKPDNDFSRWFCDVMHAVGSTTPSQCDTMLRRKPVRWFSEGPPEIRVLNATNRACWE